ncbi:homocysteine S-methyltransferase [Mesorhizobium sp. M1C.F.Ca.ET.193.01.1.1]|uniref:homocysteine S-methyltransferase family protein n=1 Tax=unclassified Mesorhizobium TaxID=325217 RepID=UPI000FD23116|nr:MULTISPECIES: homocysteine S-methyltransferase family protein [unclassified Mesorhizobium]TGT04604.1 homocysteine S-methyltransferase [bacterium M00.F.Ca.ET.177.01.1.1]TGQ57433.1 homocysteine S-methyltransferase [Mesorhizobium sp. M1C.F.Ca.ET.210.01.1.1]TGQ75890.1 homocysteine S-methyltransferase [Mesorhizobium sp. M1C.F.Ca.ET.212.01.1.1]TGR14273.1 homocysteine S-methyltransferase [Mesorhizobium sp. M1C.F.Ca.ET.204.01.1.1]TGR35435.1 homocysteine S-methyltransferase [Mesorhizobium sp. M1C.F.
MTGAKIDLRELSDAVLLTDGGLETSLVFLDGINLPSFAAFPLLGEEEGRERLDRYFRQYLDIADKYGVGFVLDTPTWRANPDWGEILGFSKRALASIDMQAVSWARALAAPYAARGMTVLVNGVVGPRGDGYRVETVMTPAEAESYHRDQVKAFGDAGADMVSAITMTYSQEAAGIARASAGAGLQSVISFTVETDGRLPSGESLKDAIETVDDETDSAPAYFMINCAHPSHFDAVLAGGGSWIRRVRGVRANASAKSHAELDAATELDPGDPVDLGRRYRAMRDRFGHIAVLGGCCGTDRRHIAAICEACL